MIHFPIHGALARLVCLAALAAPLAVHGQLSVDAESGGGYVNASDTSWHYYIDEMNRFPDRIGFICMNGYELNKTGDHRDGFMFMAECARRGNAASMIYLSQMYADGLGVRRNPEMAAHWLSKAAETGYSAAEFHYGVALLLGRGTAGNESRARYWLRRAAAGGDDDAQAVVASGFDPAVAGSRRPAYAGPR